MKAAIIDTFGDTNQFKIINMPDPVPGEKQVLVKIHAASVNPVDWKHRKGNHRLLLGSPFPIILGYDAAGVVVENGKEAHHFKPGDEVYFRSDKKYGGTYAEYVVTSESTLAIKPADISFEEAAAIPLASLTALQALRDKGDIKKTDKVLINGAAGGVGHFAIQLARELGGDVHAVSSYRHKSLMQELGFSDFIDYTKEDFKKSDRKYNIIFDAVGKENFLTCRHILTKPGVYITSLPRPKLLLHKIFALAYPGKKARALLMKSIGADLEYISKLIEEGRFKTHIDKVFSLEDIGKAHQYAEEGHTEGKIVVRII